MIEVDFKDRVPKYPGRVKVTPVDGQIDVFEMKRMDEPTETGTPLDKATFDSFLQSRLTGRFYEPTVSQKLVGLKGLTVSPIPSSGWVYDSSNRHVARKGDFVVQVSSDRNTNAKRAADAFTSEGWESEDGSESWIEIYHSKPLKVKKICFAVEFYKQVLPYMDIQGSTNGKKWESLGTLQYLSENLKVYPLMKTGDYNYYRLYFANYTNDSITVKNFAYVQYEVSTYENYFTLDKMPMVWDKGQRITIQIPSNVSSCAVDRNFFNDIGVSTILSSNKRYELRYNGTMFDAKEV